MTDAPKATRFRWRPSGRTVRVAAGLSLVTVAGGVYLPQLTHSVSREAVLNAPLVAMRSPIAGAVRGAAPGAGTLVRAGEVLTRVENPRVDRSRLSQLELEVNALRQRLRAGERQAIELALMVEELEARLTSHREATAADLRAHVLELAEQARGAQARGRERASRLERLERLAAQGAAPAAALEAARADFAEAQAERYRLARELERVEARRAALGRGIYVGLDRNDVPYSQQRLDEVRLRRIDFDGGLAQDRQKLTTIEAAAAEERARFERLAASDLAAPVDGVVVRRAVVGNAEVSADEPVIWLADCGSPSVTARLSDRYFETVRPGAAAWVRLLGQGEELLGTVESVRGLEAPAIDRFAASIEGVGEGRFLAIIRLDAAQLRQVEGGACEIGAWAKVRFEREVINRRLDAIGEAIAAVFQAKVAYTAQPGALSPPAAR